VTACDAVFRLACDCTLDGFSDSHPGRHFATHGPGGLLYCGQHGWVSLADVVSLTALVALPEN
jgi:hypothetical protein